MWWWCSADMFMHYLFAFRCVKFAFVSDSLTAAAIGSTSYGGISYTTAGRNITYGMPAGADGLNHGQSDAHICCTKWTNNLPGGATITADGIITLLTVTIERDELELIDIIICPGSVYL